MYSFTTPRTSARSEAWCACCSSKMVERMSRIVTSRSSTAPSMPGADLVVADPAAGPLQLEAGREQPLDDQVVQVPGDPVAVGDQHQLLPVRDGLGTVEGQPGLVGEREQQLALVGGQVTARRVRRSTRDTGGRQVGPQRSQQVAATAPHRALLDRVRPSHGHRLQLGVERRELGLQHRGCHPDDGHQRATALAALDDAHGARPGDPPRDAGDLLERLLQVHRRLQPLQDLLGRLEPPPPALVARVVAGVVDHRPGRRRERLHEHLVSLGELVGVGLLGEVEVAEDRAAHADRNPEEAVHDRVVLGEADRVRVGLEAAQAQRLRVVDDLAEQAPCRGEAGRSPRAPARSGRG